MANIKCMEMAQALSKDSRINTKKGFLGLSSKLVYMPTGETVKCKVGEYAPDMENRLIHLLCAEGMELRSEVAKGTIPCVAVGHFRLEVAYTDDLEFLAVQLFRFSNFSYEAITDLRFFEGEEALLVMSVL